MPGEERRKNDVLSLMRSKSDNYFPDYGNYSSEKLKTLKSIESLEFVLTHG